MMLIELFVPQGALTAARRHNVGERLLVELTCHDGAPEAAVAATRALFHVVVHEPAAWATGLPADGPRYFVRASIPGGSMITDEGRERPARRPRWIRSAA